LFRQFAGWPFGPGGQSEGRLGELMDGAGVFGAGGAVGEIICADALEFKAEPFDAILLDAPCTSTGTLRRHPDVAWLRRPTDVKALADLQAPRAPSCSNLARR
jgi:fermentation-respiration switch protein FrsA (DUF1100 family)